MRLWDLILQKHDLQCGGAQAAFDDKERRAKRGFYRKEFIVDGKPVFRYYRLKDDSEVKGAELERVHKLGLAPAYKDVWVSDDPDSRIQGTGIDSKGRKQYRYHPDHVQSASVNKFLRLYKFIKAIPKLDAQMAKHAALPISDKNKVMALMLTLVKELNLRVGKEKYAKENKSYGVTSLKKSHVKVESDDTTKLGFKAKSGKHVQYTLKSAAVAHDLQQLLATPGTDKLFVYTSATGNTVRVSDTDLNQYIQQHMGAGFTVKDFRTYAANFFFVKALLKETRARDPGTPKQIKANLQKAQESTAFYLRHTRAISKKSYTMDLIREMYTSDPGYFVRSKSKAPLSVLLDILKVFKDRMRDRVTRRLRRLTARATSIDKA